MIREENRREKLMEIGILFVSKDQFEVYAAIILAFLARLRHRIALRSIALRQITAR